jgi:hypothetical protein
MGRQNRLDGWRLLFFHYWHGGKTLVQPRLHFSRFVFQTVLIKFGDHAPTGSMQVEKLFSGGKKFQSTLEGGHAQFDLTGQNARPSGLQVEHGRVPPAARIGSLCDLLKEFSGAAVFAFIKYKVCLLQNGRDFLGKRFSNVATEPAAHG